MFRCISLLVPAGTVETNPATKRIQLTEGVITQWWIGFPPGCNDLVHVAVYEFEHQILPRGEDEDLYWGGYVYEIPENYELVDEPYEIEVRAWNEDDIYEHTITVGVALEEIEEVTLKELFTELLDTLVGR